MISTLFQHKSKASRFCLLFCLHLFLLWNEPLAIAQIGNYVSNGSFEDKYDCDPPYELTKSIYWFNIGSDTNAVPGMLISRCGSGLCTPAGCQTPKNGDSYARTTLYCLSPCSYYASRGYPKNRLKEPLKTNKTYCVKMYIVRQEASPYAVSNIGFYFGNESTDTIKLANAPITYLNPQVKNPNNNIISDTMNWTPITGTFVANGTEKYMIIGNFDSNAATTYSLVDTTFGNGVWAEYFIDAISCIEMNLPAYAGPDKSITPGDSVYIGRESDFAIDPGCIWYKLPNMSTAIDTTSGIWVKPTSTSTYVVKQVLDCSPEKWDTVVVFMDLVGMNKLKLISEELKVFPVPAKDYIQLSVSNTELLRDFCCVSIYDQLGILMQEEELKLKEGTIQINTQNLPIGMYTLQIKNHENDCFTKRLVIAQ